MPTKEEKIKHKPARNSKRKLPLYTLSTAVLKTYVIPEEDVTISSNTSNMACNSSIKGTSDESPLVMQESFQKYAPQTDICNISFVIPSPKFIVKTNDNLNGHQLVGSKIYKNESQSIDNNLSYEKLNVPFRKKAKYYTVLTNVLETYVIPHEDVISNSPSLPNKTESDKLIVSVQTKN